MNPIIFEDITYQLDKEHKMDRLDEIENIPNIIISCQEYDMLPLYLKNKYVWVKELKCLIAQYKHVERLPTYLQNNPYEWYVYRKGAHINNDTHNDTQYDADCEIDNMNEDYMSKFSLIENCDRTSISPISQDYYPDSKVCEIISTPNIIITEDEYNIMPQYLKDKYIWVKEEYTKDTYVYRKYRQIVYTSNEYNAYLHDIDTYDEIVLEENEYMHLPDYIKEKHIWVRNEDEEHSIYYSKELLSLDSMNLDSNSMNLDNSLYSIKFNQ